MKNFVPKLLVSIALASCLPAMAGITVIDFDSDSTSATIVNGQKVSTEYQNDGVTINSVNYVDGIIGNGNDIEGRQVAFDTTLSNTSDPDLEYNNANNSYNGGGIYGYTALVIEGHNFGATPGNVLILQENDNGCGDNICNDPDDAAGNPSGYFEFTFDFLVDIISLDTFDFEESSLLTAQFFDQNDDEIPSSFAFAAMIDGGFLRQNISVNGVQRLVLNLPGSGAIDNLVFKATEVPEPSSIALLSLAALFIMRRARK